MWSNKSRQILTKSSRFDTCRHHQSEIINYYKTFPTIQESTYSYLSVEMKKWKKNYESCDCGKFSIQPIQAFPAIHKIRTILLTKPVGSVLANALFLL